MQKLLLITFIALLLSLMLPLTQIANASYTVKNLNVTVTLNENSSAHVTELLQVVISNASVSQYSTNRVALNLTLSNWQALIGPLLVQHIISTGGSIYNFKFLPGPVTNQNGQHTANIILAYDVANVTFVNETAPRVFNYRFNPKVFNFEHGVSGEILTPNTTLTMILPAGSSIQSVYPIPDLPVFAFTNQYKNVTTISWINGEPLTKFALIFIIKQSIEAEVSTFFSAAYKDLGLFTYIIIALAIVLSIFYIYHRASK